MQKKVLYIGHAYHQKTKSNLFVKEIIEEKYDVTDFYFDPTTEDYSTFEKFNNIEFDILILWQIMPPLSLLSTLIKYKKVIFFPMYDNMPNLYNKMWLEYSEVTIINFCKKLHLHLLENGFYSHYIQYFPKPIDVSNLGDEQSIYFWQRTDDITMKTVERLFDAEKVKHLHLHKAQDPGFEIEEPSQAWNNKISFSSWYEQKEDMLQDIQKYAIYIAPRLYEGIGMSFLEAMAMGRLVIAPNTPTMNEYIVHGETGILYDIDKPTTLAIENIKDIQKQTIEYVKSGYEKYEKEKKSILVWIDSTLQHDIKKIEKFKNKILLNKFLSFCFSITKTKKATRVKILGIRVFKMSRKAS